MLFLAAASAILGFKGRRIVRLPDRLTNHAETGAADSRTDYLRTGGEFHGRYFAS